MINMLPAITSQPPQTGPFAAGEKPEKKDLYADLFAALFTVPPPNLRWVDSLKAAGEQGPKAETETTAAAVAKFEVPGSGAELQSVPARPAPNEGPEFLGPPVEQPKFKKLESVQLPLGPNDRMPIHVSDTCGLPPDAAGGPRSGSGVSMILPPDGDHMPIDILTLDGHDPRGGGVSMILPPDGDHMPIDVLTLDGHDPRGGGVSMILPPDGDHMPIDILTLDDHDHPQEGGVDLLEVPQGLNNTHKTREVEPTLEVKGQSHEIPVPETMPVTVVGATPLAKEPLRLPRELADGEKHEPKVGADNTSHQSEPTLLETFTANVTVDSRPKEMARAATAGRSETTEFVETISLAGGAAKKLEAEPGADFSFDSSVSGETAAVRPAPFEHAEEKLKEAILDQVGSSIADLAKEKMASPDKRELTIRLNPAELGTVEITLIKGADGVLNAHFTTDNPQTQHLLDQTLAQLRESLEDSGMKVGSLETSCNSAFSDTNGGDSSSGESRAAGIGVPLRTTFDDGPQAEEAKTNRLVNLRA